jgi:hypothetical protein
MAYFTELGLAVTNIWNGPDEIEKIIDHLTNENCKEVVIFCQTEHDNWSFSSFDKILDLAKSKNVPVTITNGTKEIYRPVPRLSDYNLIHIPNFWMSYTLCCWIREKINLDKLWISDITKLDYKYHFLSLNRLAHRHRMEMMDLLAMYDLVDSNAISWHNLEPFPYTYKFWSPKTRKLSDNFDYYYDLKMMPTEYYESFSQLVVESDVECLFVTEKTAWPLFIGKPFLVASCQGFHKHLETMGFQLYDEIFDYSFDSEKDQTLRFCMIADNFRKLSKIPLSDLNKLAESIKDKVLHNRKMIIHYATNHETYPDIIKRFYNFYKETGIIVDYFTTSTFIELEKFSYENKYL